jgi:hypothetical protein
MLTPHPPTPQTLLGVCTPEEALSRRNYSSAKNSLHLDFVLMGVSVNLPMDPMNSERTTNKTAYTRQKSVLSFSGTELAVMVIDAISGMVRKLA